MEEEVKEREEKGKVNESCRGVKERVDEGGKK